MPDKVSVEFTRGEYDALLGLVRLPDAGYMAHGFRTLAMEDFKAAVRRLEMAGQLTAIQP